MPDDRQNLYDNDEFFAGYSRARENPVAMNYTVEQPAIRALLPAVAGASVLDLGCGAGDFARWLVDQGAESVLGIEPSENMLEVARENPKPEIEFRQSFVEELELPKAQFDLVVSSLMFHYVENLNPVIRKIRQWMKPGGSLVFSIEHPIATASQGKRPGWIKDETGERTGWEITDYSSEGERVSYWIVDGVVKYHRTIATILNMLTKSGFRNDRISEDHASPESEALDPGLLEERMRPPFLFVRALAD
jgi:2-polyprenyl-3-methyl-5-hydroxy-6-metoxy-1,4-benzoquinol methylase